MCQMFDTRSVDIHLKRDGDLGRSGGDKTIWVTDVDSVTSPVLRELFMVRESLMIVYRTFFVVYYLKSLMIVYQTFLLIFSFTISFTLVWQ